MQGLSAHDLLALWDLGVETTDPERGLLMLAHCLPEKTWAELAAVRIGRRDCLLMELRRATVGTAVGAFASCPRCEAHLEFELEPEAIGLSPAQSVTPETMHHFVAGSYVVECRLPDSTDLYAAGSCSDIAAVRRLIVSRCVSSIASQGELVPTAEAPDAVVDAFAMYLSREDPAAEIVLRMACPECDCVWELGFDIVRFFWREIESAARRLLLEVDALARSYGWSEAEILGLTLSRRQLYLEMVG
jgi:hypothetical protein